MDIKLGEDAVSYVYNPFDAPRFKGGLSANFGGTVFQDKPNSRHDIVSVYSYDGTTVSHLQLDFDVETGTLNSESGILHNSDTISSKLSYNTGFVYNAGSSYIILDKNTAADGTANFAQPNLRTFAINYNSLRNVYVYDSEEETVTSVSPAVIKTYLEYGASASDFAVVRHNLGLANIVYIYR